MRRYANSNANCSKKSSGSKKAELGFEALLANSATQETTETAAIEWHLLEIKAEFNRFTLDSAFSINISIRRSRSTSRLSRCHAVPTRKHLRVARVSLTLNRMNINVSGGDAAKTENTLTFDDVLIGKNRRVTASLVRLSDSEFWSRRTSSRKQGSYSI